MARIVQNEFSAKSDATDINKIEINAAGQETVIVPSSEFISDSVISRDGQDLLLESPEGELLVIQNYFSEVNPPLLESPDGSVLTDSLVNSFLSSSPEYAQASSMTDESPVGAVEEINGEATVTRTDGTSESLTLGTPIYQGDVIETSETGAVNIMFIDETSMAVSNNARMAIDEYQFDPSTESGETNLSVLRGVFVFTSGLIGRDDPDDVLIDTPVGSIGIRGTIIAGKIDPAGESEITVIEGAIVVKNAKTETTLSEQFETVKIFGYNTKMQDIGVKDSQNIGETYGSVSDVVPKLFSSINDNMKESSDLELKDKSDDEPIIQEEEILDPAVESIEENGELSTEIQLENSQDSVIQDINSEPTLDGNIEIVNEEKLINDVLLQEETLNNNLFEPIDNQLLEPTFEAKDPLFNQTDRETSFNTTGTTSLDTTNPDIFVDLPLVLKASASFLFEGKNVGDVVGRFFTEGGAIGTKSFKFDNGTNTSTDGTLTLVQVAPNTVEIRLTAAAPTAGNTLGTNFTIVAKDSAGQQTAINMAPLTVMDAVVNLNSPDGILYPFNPSGALPLKEMIGDVNGDGQNDFIRNNGTTLEIIDGGTNNTLWSQAGTSISSIGDLDNDGYADVIAGNGSATNGLFLIIEGGASVNALTPTPGSTTGDMVGESVVGLGDFDGDGKSDYAVGAPGVSSGQGAVLLQLSSGSTTIAGAAGQGTGMYLANLNDINGDGLTDLAIGNATGNAAYIFYGNNGPANNVGGADLTITTSAGESITGLGSAGDFNGDGFDDFAISLDNGTDINTYIVYSTATLPGTINLTYLEDPQNALKLNDAGTTGVEYEIRSLGDIDGDGFDDIQIGSSGSYYTVYGGLGGNNTPYVMDNAPNDADTGFGIIEASGNGQALVGDGHFNDGGHTNLSMKGGDNNNLFKVTSTQFRNIDGGKGLDTIEFGLGGNNLDFTSINFESISQIEQIRLANNTSTITLTTENIFNLLKSSDDGSLRISAPSGGNLNIDAPTATGGTTTSVVAALNEDGAGATHQGTNGAYDHFQIGGYNLYIDQNLTTAVV